jgi:NAD+ synthetase
VCAGGRVVAVCDKRLLPGYDVFDEDRYFEPGRAPCVVVVGNRRLGVLICEDFWQAQDVAEDRTYPVDPTREVTERGCDCLVILNASHFVRGKWQRHIQQQRAAAARYGLPIVAVHQVGGNDDLIYDGRSVAVDGGGSPVAVLPGWTAAVETIELVDPGAVAAPGLPADVGLKVDPLSEVFQALVLGIRDYCGKTGHQRVVLGLSGGIDSAVVACLAVAALGPANVSGVMMPSRYSSAGSVEDATELAANLGMAPCDNVSIESLHTLLHEVLAGPLGDAGGVTDENIQARIRGVLLMAMSNTMGSLVLVPSNKSELATGYATIYGDMCGALLVLGDVLKTRVYALAEWINACHADCGFASAPIPERSLTKAPSAELRPHQTDQDTLPPYEVLDQIVEGYIERELSVRQIVEETDIDPAVVHAMARMIDLAQHKRDQAAPVLKVTPRTFGRGRPMPIAMRWEEVQSRHGDSKAARAGRESDRRR